jgi:DHA3 family macrolide efflux protein-like MFS transporter
MTKNKAANWKRTATLFVIGQFVSMFGSMIVQYAITWHITLSTKSGFIMTLFACAAILPMTLVSPFAGVLADRYSRKKIIILSDACIALVTLLLAVLYISGYQNIWIIFIAVIARSLGQGIQQPAVSAMIQQIVPQEGLLRFNSIQGTINSVNTFVSPMVAGIFLSFMTIEYIFFIDVVTAAIGIGIMFLFVKTAGVSQVKKTRGVKAYFREFKEGIRYISTTQWLKILLLYNVFFSFFVAPAAFLTPLQIARSFGDEVWRLTAVETAYSLGAIAGGIAIVIWGGFKNKTHTMIFACILFGITTMLLGIVPLFWVYLGVMLLCGTTFPLSNTPSTTLLQSNVDTDKIGRVFSVLMMFSGLALPLGMAVFGPLSDIIKIEWLLIISGAVICLSGLLLFNAKPLLKIGKPAPKATNGIADKQQCPPPKDNMADKQ